MIRIEAAAWQVMLHNDHQLFQFHWHGNNRGQDDDERAVGFARADLLGQRLDDLCRLQETVEVDEHQDGRAIGRSQSVDRPDGGQRIAATGIGSLAVGRVGELQAALDIPNGQPPLLVAAHLGDLGQSIVMLVGLDPQAGETCGNVFRQPLC